MDWRKDRLMMMMMMMIEFQRRFVVQVEKTGISHTIFFCILLLLFLQRRRQLLFLLAIVVVARYLPFFFHPPPPPPLSPSLACLTFLAARQAGVRQSVSSLPALTTKHPSPVGEEPSTLSTDARALDQLLPVFRRLGYISLSLLWEKKLAEPCLSSPLLCKPDS